MVRKWRRRYLLDVWVEGRLVPSLPAVVRGRVRDMATERDTYVGSFAEVEAMVEADLDEDGVTPRRWEHDGDG